MGKKDNYQRIELAIMNNICFKLIIPSKKNKDKYPKYYIEYTYNGKQYQATKNIKKIYMKFDKWATETKIEKIDRSNKLVELFRINVNTILDTLGLKDDSISSKMNIYNTVLNSIEAFFKHHETQYAMGDLKGLTNYADRNKKLTYFLSHKYPNLLIKELNATVWNHFRSFLKEQGKANSTVNQYITYVKSWYNWIINYHEVPLINHANKLKKLDVSQQTKKFKNLDSQVVADFIKAVSSNDKWLRLELIVRLIGENTIRPVQVRNIKAKHIDNEKRTILIYDNKGNKWRTIEVTERVQYLISRIYLNSAERNIEVNENDYLIGGYNSFKQGKPYTQMMVRDLLIKPFRKEFPQFESINIYDFKHTSITKASSLGNLLLVQQRAGHSKLDTTQIYNLSEKKSKAISMEELITIK